MASPRRRELISQREYARRHDVTHGAVQRAIKSGRITTVRGRIDPTIADQEWQANTDLSKPRNRITGRPKLARAGSAPLEPMDFGAAEGGHGGNGTATGYARAQAARELYRAQLTKLELDEKRGILVRADEVKLGAFNMARRARDQLVSLTERMSAVLGPKEQQILEEAVERICMEIADAERP